MTETDVRYSWTQPCCEDCWNERHPDREAVRVIEGAEEICVYCGKKTVSGIYVRIDPKEAPHPSITKDD